MSMFRNYSYDDITKIAQSERNHHPMSKLIDYYKLFYQSFYGQGHFIGNESEAKRHLENELVKITNAYYPILQDISNQNGLYRISLDAIRTGIMSEDELLILYLDSKFIQTDWQAWSEMWGNVSHILLDLYPDLSDAILIRQCSDVIKNKAVISHSECFRLTYSPHYRVMQLSEYDLHKHSELRKYL